MAEKAEMEATAQVTAAMAVTMEQQPWVHIRLKNPLKPDRPCSQKFFSALLHGSPALFSSDPFGQGAIQKAGSALRYSTVLTQIYAAQIKYFFNSKTYLYEFIYRDLNQLRDLKKTVFKQDVENDHRR